jgi:HlyD family secretion protein
MKSAAKNIVIGIPVSLTAIAILYLLFTTLIPEDKYITGITETTVVDVSSKIPGRIDSLFVDEGELVKKGTILAKLESKEIKAKVEQAKAAMEAAKAKMNLVKKGTRKEQIEAAEKLMLQAKHQFEFTEKTYKRFKELYKDSLISLQSFDEIEFKYNATNAQYQAAKANYEMALNGARDEEIEAVTAIYNQAVNAYKEAKAYEEELELKAPVDGEVYNIISDAGEVIASGYPVFSLMIENDDYVVIQVREDEMSKIKMGEKFKGKVTALNKESEFKVKYISPMADFATWRPTNQKGEFDLKTFEVRLYPVEPLEGLRPGMTVNIKL